MRLQGNEKKRKAIRMAFLQAGQYKELLLKTEILYNFVVLLLI
jgi:hypothetical protein